MAGDHPTHRVTLDLEHEAGAARTATRQRAPAAEHAHLAGEIAALVDDDRIVGAHWLDDLQRAFEDDEHHRRPLALVEQDLARMDGALARGGPSAISASVRTGNVSGLRGIRHQGSHRSRLPFDADHGAGEIGISYPVQVIPVIP